MDPVILSAITISLLVWAVVGGGVYAALRQDCPPGFQTTWFTLVCGPAAWALGALTLWRATRHRMLRAFGVQGYTCCGGHEGHQHHSHSQRHPDWEPSAKGKSGGNGRCRGHGYPPDSVLNHPAIS